jgi:hypothetical protein
LRIADISYRREILERHGTLDPSLRGNVYGKQPGHRQQ